MGETVSALRRLEGSLAGLYSRLSVISRFTGTSRVIFQKIAMDSMEHEEVLKLLEDRLSRYEELIDENVVELCNSVSEEALRLSESVNSMSEKEILERLRSLERGEEIAYQIYDKIMKEATAQQDDVLRALMRGIAEDERQHDELLKLILR
ncbi:MAG: hypothetical protein ACP5LW_04435 [Nitrososphaeria archaeon]